MLAYEESFSGFAVPDIAEARAFYGETLGLDIDADNEEDGLLPPGLARGRDTLIYVKPDHQPATYTILNFRVSDIDAAVNALSHDGIALERSDGFDQDAKCIASGRAWTRGPNVAWFKDPAGNILSVLQE